MKVHIPPINWSFNSISAEWIEITGTMPGISLTFPLRTPYGETPISYTMLIAEIKALEAVLTEAYVLNERRKETP